MRPARSATGLAARAGRRDRPPDRRSRWPPSPVHDTPPRAIGVGWVATMRLPCDLEGDVALVTGCGSAHGIGFACAQTLARLGARVAITSATDRILDRALRLEAGSARVSAHVADLTDPDQATRLSDEVERHARVDILVTAAGIAAVGSPAPARLVAELTPEDWRRELDVNLMTAILPARAVLPR